ncbi:MAG: hypothetical protein DHS20C18_28940 [Saprospiraceae bacterium]|nr:MAG: hypothetical protein DHS20C18_28940 [Saprospiraceae bacterium]
MISCLRATAQDPQLSNYFNNPLQLNPALTGQIPNHSTRIQVGSRDQWRSVLNSGAFITSFIAFDKRFCAPIEGDYWAIGANVLGDQRGDFPLQRLDAFLSGTYMKRLADNSNFQTYLGVGLEGGAIHHRLGKNDFSFDEQFDNPQAAGETFDQYNFTVLDYGVGLSFYIANKEQTNLGFNIGAAIKHLGEPEYQFFAADDGSDARLKRRYVVHAGLAIPIRGDQMGLSLKSVFMDQQPYTQLINQIDLIFGKRENSIFTIGAGLRLTKGFDGIASDALIISTSLTLSQFLISISYDTNISTLHPASSSIGALELSLGIVFGREDCKIVYCPGM